MSAGRWPPIAGLDQSVRSIKDGTSCLQPAPVPGLIGVVNQLMPPRATFGTRFLAQQATGGGTSGARATPTPGPGGSQSTPPSAPRAEPGTAGTHNRHQYRVYQDDVYVDGDRNWRNNNPGNIRDSDFTDQHGAIGDDGAFAIFPDAATGLAALRALLRTPTYQQLTMRDAIARFAPPNENNTQQYLQYLRNATGLDPNMRLNQMNDAQLESVINAILHFEGGRPGRIYNRNDPNLPDWIRTLLGVPQSQPAPAPTPSTSPAPNPAPPPTPPAIT